MRARAVLPILMAAGLVLASCGGQGASQDTVAIEPAPETTTEVEEETVSTVEGPPAAPAEAVGLDIGAPEPPEPEVVEEEEEPPPPMDVPPDVHPGDTGPLVEDLEHRLLAIGYPLPDGVTGAYEGLSVEAVQHFQRTQDLPDNGVVEYHTWVALADPAPFKPPTLVYPDAPVETASVEEQPAQPAPPAPGQVLGHLPPGGIGHIVVRLGIQHVDVYGVNGEHAFSFPTSTGRNGATPVGSFRITHRSASTVSTTDHSISMNWMTNFNGFIGFHGIPRTGGGEPLWTPLGEQAVSAGCVRLSDEAANIIYVHAPNGTPVDVVQ